jgi:hypothetical protein
MTVRGLGITAACLLWAATAGAQGGEAADAAAVAEGEPAEAAPAAADTRGPGELLAEAKQLYEALDYDRVIPIAEQVLAHAEVDIEQRLDAYLLQGSSLAIVGNQVDAETPFRFLLRGRPDFDMPPQTPPKILAVFRKVQVEERAIVEQMEALQRKNIVKAMRIDGVALEELKGGVPIHFDIAVLDPRGALRSVRIDYRRAGSSDFSSLPLEQQPSGRWGGEVSGEWTENDNGFVLEYRVVTLDAGGQGLLAMGLDTPLTANVAPGTVAGAVPFYQTFWFWGLTGVAAAAVVGSGAAVTVAAALPPGSDLGAHAVD